MIYLIINLVIAAALITFSSVADVNAGEIKSRTLINFALILSVTTLLNSLCIVLSFWNNPQLVSLFGRLEYFLIGVTSIQYSFFLIRYPYFKRNAGLSVLQWIMYALAAYITFSTFNVVTYSPVTGMSVQAADFMEYMNLNWYGAYMLATQILIPAFAVLSLLLRLEVTKERMLRQNMFLLIGITATGWGVYYLVFVLAVRYIPGYTLLFPILPAALAYFAFSIVNRQSNFELRTVVRRVGSFILYYAVPGVMVGLLVAWFQRYRYNNFPLYVVLLAGVTFIAYALIYGFDRWLHRSRDANVERFYEVPFENALSAIDYDDENLDLSQTVVSIFRKYIKCHSIEIMLENTAEEALETFYTTGGRNHRIPLSSKILDAALNENRTVIFRDHVENHYRLPTVKKELLELFRDTNSEVLILLQEGRHIFGAILLGEHVLGNDYNDYEYNVFTRLYSYFFVIGYYLRNKQNEEVVGTVNREISMSGQIIQSIQENLDFINNPKVDVGYLSIAAHNLGGEYYDFIRLTDTKHIVVLGDISGKGINASMSTVILKSIVRTYLAETRDFKQLVLKVNSFIRNNLPKGTFFAGVFALIDFEENAMYYINCGIPALFMYNPQFNNIVEIQGEGRVLGFVRQLRKLVKVRKIDLVPGNVLLATTDGLLEGHSIRGESFGRERVQRSLMSNMGFPASKICEFLHQELLDFTSQELEDDVSIIAIKVLNS
ncbi:MAG: serine/threonine-protein phosphatase [Treponemataceae bacterium]|nr:serine/threonine-protein phosphatase [Treponemataceae bacterium]